MHTAWESDISLPCYGLVITLPAALLPPFAVLKSEPPKPGHVSEMGGQRVFAMNCLCHINMWPELSHVCATLCTRPGGGKNVVCVLM